MNFILVTPEALRSHWPRIKTSLEAVQAKAPEDWICEDVYHAIKAGEAACHIAVDGQGYAGLLITQALQADYSREPLFHVWITHNASDADVFTAGLAMVRDMAKIAGARRITFGSPRNGWGKRFPLVSATYEIPWEDA